MIRIEHNPSRSQLLTFALLWLLFFVFWGTLSWWKSGMCAKAAAFWIAAFAVPAAGIVWPGFLRKVYLAACYAALPIGLIVSSVALVFIYYLILTPIGFALKLTGYDPMRRAFDHAAKTYWIPKGPEHGLERYFRQF